MRKIIILSVIIGIALLSYYLITSKKAKSQNTDSNTTTITILHTADIHGQLEVHDEMLYLNDEITFKKLGGLSHMKTLFNNVRAENPDATLTLDGGDYIQGAAVAALSKGRAFAPIVKAMEYDFLIPGNWEVVYGKDIMIEVMEQYDAPIISANMFHENSDEYIFHPYFIKEIQGVKLGFISYNDPDIPVRQNPSYSKGIRFTPVDYNLSETIDQLKDKEKVDILFLVTHIGISKQVDLANSPALERVDYILGNDTHERIRKLIQGKYAKVTEPGAFASFVGRLDITVKDGQIVNDSYDLMEVDPKIYPADPTIAKIVEEETAPYLDQINEVLGYTTTPMYRYFVIENPMDNFITDVMRWKTGADISLSNGFRFSPPLVPENDEPAAITAGHLWSFFPVDEKVKVGKATGRQLKDWMEKEINNVFAENPQDRFGGWLVRFSGMTLVFDSSKPMGERVIEMKVNDEPLDYNKEYTVSACDREGEPPHILCRLQNAKDTQILDYSVHDVIKEYLSIHKTISPVTDGRAKAIDLGDNYLFHLPGTDYKFY